MAFIRKEFLVDASVEQAWDVVRDVGAVHTRFARGFVTDTKMDGDARIVTFANGMTAREVIVDLNEEARRLSYAIVGGRLSHHNASFQVFAEGERTRFVWSADLLPNDLKATIDNMMEAGCAAVKRTFAERIRPKRMCFAGLTGPRNCG